MKYSIFIIILLFALQANSQTYKNVGAVEFKKLIETNKGILMDTRTKGEYDRGHIAGATLFDLRDQNIREQILALPKNKPIYIYCYSGARSKSVANFMAQSGYTDITNLQRGIIDWSNNGFNLEKISSAASTVLTDAVSVVDYEKLISSDKLVFVDFYAPWCAPCKQLMPIVDQLKNEYSGKVKIVKVNSDASSDLMKTKSVKGVPYLVLYKYGKPVFEKYGTLTKDELKKLFDDNL